MAFLSIPQLQIEGQCQYTETNLVYDWAVRDNGGSCSSILGTTEGSGEALKAYIESLKDEFGYPLHSYAANQSGINTVTRDGRFAMESVEKHHLTVWNRNFVLDEKTDNIVLRESGKSVGVVHESVRNTDESRFADQNGKNYLLIMESGTRLKVYAITQ